jgi:rod shape-determining protein MreD
MIHIKTRFLVAFLLMMALTILPLPAVVSGFRPVWVFLLVIYTQLFMPSYFGTMFLFCLGICLDILLSTFIGEHAFAMLFTTWLISGKSRRFSFFPVGQQMVMIGIFCLMYQMIIVFIDAFIGYRANMIFVVGSSIVSMLIWPWFKMLADGAFSRNLSYRSFS